jgi:hypothetical protein
MRSRAILRDFLEVACGHRRAKSDIHSEGLYVDSLEWRVYSYFAALLVVLIPLVEAVSQRAK